jgi:hypothetical protein
MLTCAPLAESVKNHVMGFESETFRNHVCQLIWTGMDLKDTFALATAKVMMMHGVRHFVAGILPRQIDCYDLARLD